MPLLRKGSVLAERYTMGTKLGSLCIQKEADNLQALRALGNATHRA